MDVIQYGDLDIQKVKADALITHVLNPLAFTVNKNEPLLEQAFNIIDNSESEAAIVSDSFVTKIELAAAFSSIEVFIIELPKCYAISAWWISHSIHLLEKFTRASQSIEIHRFLESLKLHKPQMYSAALLMDRKKFLRDGEGVEAPERFWKY